MYQMFHRQKAIRDIRTDARNIPSDCTVLSMCTHSKFRVGFSPILPCYIAILILCETTYTHALEPR